MGRVAERSALSPLEYLEWERQQPARHEFFRGARERYVYPDVSIVGGSVALEAGTADVVTNPTILVEVLFDGVLALPAD